ncbi:39S ribosomal protein L14, mitochondrial [Trachymyrmex cornetzi]|uniref:Large ribosomal subunit protein uL14m n=1 Tax=Trachymyrmex cornetzi TaxID=471704 RepID=A0A195DYY4_9HYME|nr:39S ribosomal protein L14, mitochondrial [Trachymyrmex cornetzi]
MLSPFAVSSVASRNISTSTPVSQIIKRPLRCIHVYDKRWTRVGYIGDRILDAIRGEKEKNILVGLKQQQVLKVPKFDSNNLVLVDDNGTTLGTRIQVPIPHIFQTKMKEQTYSKGADYTKLIAIASMFV